jgi:hypothetical protein
LVGWVPPLSAFMVAILAKYGLLLAHLDPNGLLSLFIQKARDTLALPYLSHDKWAFVVCG